MKKISFFAGLVVLISLMSCTGNVTKTVDTSEKTSSDPYVTPVYNKENPPVIQNKAHASIKKGGLEFNDASGDGTLQPYEDWRLSPAERASDLVSRISLEQKVGLLNQPGHASVTSDGSLGENDDDYIAISEDFIRYGLVRLNTKPIVTATYHNNLQELCQSQEWGIPYIVSADPLNDVKKSNTSDNVSLWPSQVGFGAINNTEITREFAEMMAEEYRAMGIRMALHPMADTATDPRWDRVGGSFGSNFYLNALHTVEYVKGLQGGDRLLPGGIIATVKHFAGYGAGYKGYDGHYQLGSVTRFDGDNFKSHLIPFEAAFTEANAAAAMPMYPAPDRITSEQLPGGYNKELLDLGREIGFTGFYTSDWGIYGGHPNTGWNVKALNQTQKVALSQNAGMNAYGGSTLIDQTLEAIEQGLVSEEVISLSAERILKAMFAMGLFEDPYAEIPASDDLFTTEESTHWTAGLEAQKQSLVMLKNEKGALPVKARKTVYFDGFDDGTSEEGKALLAEYGVEAVEKPSDASVAIIRIESPSFPTYPFGSNSFFKVSSRSLQFIDEKADEEYGVEGIEYTDRYGNHYESAQLASNFDQLQKIYDARDEIEAAGSNTKLIVVVNMPKPTIVKEYIDEVDGLIVDFGAIDKAVLDLIFSQGGVDFTGKLPFQISRSDANVEKTLEDLMDDDLVPHFDSGFGLSYQ